MTHMVTTGCPVLGRCGGCPWIDVPYPEQLERKQRMMEDLFGSLCDVSPIAAMSQPEDCRNKVIVPGAPTEDGRSFYGLYQDGRCNFTGPDSCIIMANAARPVFRAACDLMHPDGLAGSWAERTIRHVTIRTSLSTGQIMVTFVCRTHLLESGSASLEAFLERCPQVTTVVENINDGAPCEVYGDESRILFGPGYIEDRLLDCTFRISPRSFYQINPYQTPVFYQAALDYAGLTGDQMVLDAYSGTGTIGILASLKAASVIGFENNADAVADARVNASINDRDNIRFDCGDAAESMANLIASGRKIDVAFLDPPRKGAQEAFLTDLDRLDPARTVYISCNPQTQKRDCSILARRGWNIEGCKPVDVFPYTPHVESVVLLTRH